MKLKCTKNERTKFNRYSKKITNNNRCITKWKIKIKTSLTTLKEYVKLASEKEDQINNIKKAISDINTQMKIEQNQEKENNISSKVSNLFGSIFSKKLNEK